MKDKTLVPGIYFSLGMIFIVMAAYLIDSLFIAFAFLSITLGLLKVYENYYEKLE